MLVITWCIWPWPIVCMVCRWTAARRLAAAKQRRSVRPRSTQQLGSLRRRAVTNTLCCWPRLLVQQRVSRSLNMVVRMLPQVPGYYVAYCGNIAFDATATELEEVFVDCSVTQVRRRPC